MVLQKSTFNIFLYFGRKMFKKFKVGLVITAAAITVVFILHIYDVPKLSSIIGTKLLEHIEDQTLVSLDGNYLIPNEVYYVWCAKKAVFKFRHYLSVKSVMKFIQPNKVVLFYEDKPLGSEYDTWLDDLVSTFPMFSLAELPVDVCNQANGTFEHTTFNTGGIYIREDVILTSFNHQYRSYFNSLTVNDSHGKTLVKFRSHNQSARDLANNFGSSVRVLRGGKLLANSTTEKGLILGSSLPGTPLDLWESTIWLFIADYDFLPAYIWKLDSDVGQMLRSVMYNTPHFVDAVPNYDQLAPNIAHIVWTNNDTMKFSFYLCVLSLVDIAKVDKLYIHGESSPSGFYWNLIKNHPKIKLVYRTYTGSSFESVYGQKVETGAHVVDVWRLYILQRFGGLYVDTDALFFRPLDREIRSYDVVMSKYINTDPMYPDGIYQNGIMLGKPGAKFWNVHIEAYKHYRRESWLYNCCIQIYKIKERFPELVHEDPRLNVICSNQLCFPTWLPNCRDGTTDNHLVTGSMKNWKTDSYAIHHTYPDLPEFADHVKLLANNGSTLFGEVALYILEKAGKIDFFKKLTVVGL